MDLAAQHGRTLENFDPATGSYSHSVSFNLSFNQSPKLWLNFIEIIIYSRYTEKKCRNETWLRFLHRLKEMRPSRGPSVNI